LAFRTYHFNAFHEFPVFMPPSLSVSPHRVIDQSKFWEYRSHSFSCSFLCWCRSYPYYDSS